MGLSTLGTQTLTLGYAHILTLALTSLAQIGTNHRIPLTDKLIDWLIVIYLVLLVGGLRLECVHPLERKITPETRCSFFSLFDIIAVHPREHCWVPSLKFGRHWFAYFLSIRSAAVWPGTSQSPKLGLRGSAYWWKYRLVTRCSTLGTVLCGKRWKMVDGDIIIMSECSPDMRRPWEEGLKQPQGKKASFLWTEQHYLDV